jgi:hypothetical protein
MFTESTLDRRSHDLDTGTVFLACRTRVLAILEEPLLSSLTASCADLPIGTDIAKTLII